MGSFVEALAKKLADQWLGLLLLPGILFAAAATIGIQLGQQHALDYEQLRPILLRTAASVAGMPVSSQALLAIGVLLAAGATGLVTQALAATTRRVWLGRWPRVLALPQRRLTARRQARWRRRLAQRRALEQAHPRTSRTPDQQTVIDTAADQVNSIAWAEPGRPTWMGDRVHALEQIARHRYGLDLTFAWPRLWLVLPDTARAEITTAHAGFAAAVATGTWALPYLLLGTVWWPAVLVGIGIGTTGWARARAAITDITALTEAALDLHSRALAVALGVAAADTTGPLAIAEGEQVTALTRKGR